MEINLIAVQDYAQQIADVRAAGGDWQGELDQASVQYRDQVRAWLSGDGQADPRFAQVMDAFVRRGDKGLVVTLQTAIEHSQVAPEVARDTWQEFDALPTVEARRSFVDRFVREHSR